jgi:hypothetical protein
MHCAGIWIHRSYFINYLICFNSTYLNSTDTPNINILDHYKLNHSNVNVLLNFTFVTVNFKVFFFLFCFVSDYFYYSSFIFCLFSYFEYWFIYILYVFVNFFKKNINKYHNIKFLQHYHCNYWVLKYCHIGKYHRIWVYK